MGLRPGGGPVLVLQDFILPGANGAEPFSMVRGSELGVETKDGVLTSFKTGQEFRDAVNAENAEFIVWLFCNGNI